MARKSWRRELTASYFEINRQSCIMINNYQSIDEFKNLVEVEQIDDAKID